MFDGVVSGAKNLVVGTMNFATNKVLTPAANYLWNKSKVAPNASMGQVTAIALTTFPSAASCPHAGGDAKAGMKEPFDVGCVTIKRHEILNRQNQKIVDILKGTKVSQEALEGDFVRWRHVAILGLGQGKPYEFYQEAYLKALSQGNQEQTERKQKTEILQQLATLFPNPTGENDVRVHTVSRLLGQSTCSGIAEAVNQHYPPGKDANKRVKPQKGAEKIEFKNHEGKIWYTFTQTFALEALDPNGKDDENPFVLEGYIPTTLEIKVPVEALQDPENLLPSQIETAERCFLEEKH